MHIDITTNIPTIPVDFFIIFVYPDIVSTASPSIEPTTGTEVATVLPSFFVVPSKLEVKLPSNPATLITIVKMVVNANIDPLSSNFEIFVIEMSFDKFAIIEIVVETNIKGKITFITKLLDIVTIISNIGSRALDDAILPDAINNVISNGINEFENADRLSIESFISEIISAKFFITIVTIKMYST